MSQYTVFDGYNADSNNDDEANGAGTNWPVWTLFFDTFVGLEPLLMSQVMLDAFNDNCPDYSVAGVNDTLMIPAEPETLVIRGRR